ncbi:MAG: DUF5681 domain-containing protein [Acetobacter peroxydans]|jgi:hypothetical protein|nr:DUF5681 domain-containing protein [Acetobacter peroxydans]
MTEQTSQKWVRGMKSPNPRGRPKGIIDKRQRINQSLVSAGDEIAQIVVNRALEGDMQAAALILARISAPLKARADMVRFELDGQRPLGEQAQQIMDAVSKGDIDPETGKGLIACVQTISGIHAVAELEQRLIRLEEAQK